MNKSDENYQELHDLRYIEDRFATQKDLKILKLELLFG